MIGGIGKRTTMDRGSGNHTISGANSEEIGKKDINHNDDDSIVIIIISIKYN